MQEQFAIPNRGVIFAIPVRILADVGIHQPRLIRDDRAVGFLELNGIVLGGLYFSPGQHHAGLEAVEQKIVVPGRPVLA